MRKVVPYLNERNALRALDNGGRFYNLFTKAEDRVVSSSELYRAAGIFSGEDKAFLFFEMALRNLSPDSRNRIIASLSAELSEAYHKRIPRTVSAEDFQEAAETTQPLIVEGIPRFLEDRTRLTTFIMVPISSGSTTTFMMVPIFEQYDIYEVYRDLRKNSSCALVACSKGKKKLPEEPMVFGGLVKESTSSRKGGEKTLFLETLYYINSIR